MAIKKETMEKKVVLGIEGTEQYLDAMKKMREATIETRKEIEQLNLALERKAELLKQLG